MYQYKVGDRVRHNEKCDSRGEEGVLYFSFGTLQTHVCETEGHWQLISPKERTIEEVKVGDVCEDDTDTFQIVEVLKNTFAYMWLGGINWKTFEDAKRDGWKIKQPEPEKHNKVCPYGNDDCPKCK